MTKAELINAVHDSLDNGMSKKDTGLMVQTVIDTISGAIRDEGRFSYPGFGTWKSHKRNARTGRNPQTGAAITIPAKTVVKFKPATSLNDLVDN
jgi:DNA-binding protein HU-beta